MSDAEQQPTTVSGAANTIKGLLNQSADTQPAPTETETVTEETLTQAEEPIAPSNVPDEPNALSEEYDESVESDIVETTELSEEPIFPVVIDGQKYEVSKTNSSMVINDKQIILVKRKNYLSSANSKKIRSNVNEMLFKHKWLIYIHLNNLLNLN